MHESLTIAVAQPRCIALDVRANAVLHAAAIRDADARVVVFPELSLTGYEFDAPPIAADDPRLQPIVDACRAMGATALVGAPVAGAGGRPMIAMLAVDPAGARVIYAKMWLGGAEPECFESGTSPAVIEVDSWRLGLAICRDTGIAQHATDTAVLGIDAYVAGVLEFAEDAAVPEMRARRIAADHHVWVAMASFAGSTGGGYDDAAGGSGIWAPDGSVVARVGREPGEIASATLTRRDDDARGPGAAATLRTSSAS